LFQEYLTLLLLCSNRRDVALFYARGWLPPFLVQLSSMSPVYTQGFAAIPLVTIGVTNADVTSNSHVDDGAADQGTDCT
jgi:hypothetical protein